MSDPPTQAAFYASRRGAVARDLVRDRLVHAWPSVGGMTLLGLGYTTPYLDAWPDARVTLAAGPDLPADAWPDPTPNGARNRAAVTEDDALPFADLTFDRILLVHALETTESARRMLREVWRVLRDDGQVLVVAPNRRGVWAHLDSTPFGQGQPYSSGQISRLLGASLFRVTWRDDALFVPPVACVEPLARVWERIGRRVLPGGVTITGASKNLYAGLPLKPVRRRRAVVLSGLPS